MFGPFLTHCRFTKCSAEVLCTCVLGIMLWDPSRRLVLGAARWPSRQRCITLTSVPSNILVGMAFTRVLRLNMFFIFLRLCLSSYFFLNASQQKLGGHQLVTGDSRLTTSVHISIHSVKCHLMLMLSWLVALHVLPILFLNIRSI